MNIPADSQPNQHATSPWDFIDRVYCISLEHRTDRREQATAQFAKVGLADRVEFVINQKHPTNAELGNFESQVGCLRKALATGAQTIMVFEDDILFDRFTPSKLSNAIDFMRSDTGWHMFFLGGFMKTSRKTKFPSVINVRFRSTTHAYVVTRAFAEKLVQIPWPGHCLDDLIASMNDEHMYAIYPAIAFQSNSATDNDKQIAIDRFRRALGGIRRLQKWNEFSTLYFFRLIAIHTIVIVLLIAAFLLWHYVR